MYERDWNLRFTRAMFWALMAMCELLNIGSDYKAQIEQAIQAIFQLSERCFKITGTFWWVQCANF